MNCESKLKRGSYGRRKEMCIEHGDRYLLHTTDFSCSFKRRVTYWTNTLANLLTTSRSTPGELVICQENWVEEAVDTLLVNGICGQLMIDGHNKVYKSFSDIVEGKEGRFHETLLGKWVDHSGRFVNVVGLISITLMQISSDITIELFHTFVIHGLIKQHLALNIEIYKSKI